MFNNILKTTALALTTVSAMQSACPSQQQEYQSSASQWPKPTGDVSSYISSYSSAHNGVFSNCQHFTSGMPASLSSPYQAWVTSANDWSISFESTVAAAASTCVGFVANVVIALPRCEGDAVATDSSSASTTGSGSSSVASSTASSAVTTSSGTAPLTRSYDASFLAMVICAGAMGALAIVL